VVLAIGHALRAHEVLPRPDALSPLLDRPEGVCSLVYADTAYINPTIWASPRRRFWPIEPARCDMYGAKIVPRGNHASSLR
jgi:hypothetical protein